MNTDNVSVRLPEFVIIKNLEHPKYPGVKVFARVFKLTDEIVDVLLPTSVAEELNVSLWAEYSIDQVEFVDRNSVTLGQLKEFGVSPHRIIPELN